MKDYAKGRVGDKTLLGKMVRGHIRKACAEAIADTKRARDRRAARIVTEILSGPQAATYTLDMVIAKILGKDK